MSTKFRIRAFSFALLGWTAACDVFEPRYPETVTQSAAQGLQSLSELVAKAELGDFRTPGSYSGASDKYAQTLARIEVARSWVAGQADPKDTRPLAQAAMLMSEDLTSCIQGVRDMAERHKSSGLPERGTSTVRFSCEIPINNIIQ